MKRDVLLRHVGHMAAVSHMEIANLVAQRMPEAHCSRTGTGIMMAMAAKPELHYQIVDPRARPGRIAMLIDSTLDRPMWRQSARSIIQYLCSTWGGDYSLIVPTDGKSIDPVFWSLLETFSPDYVQYYIASGSDLKVACPDEYQAQFDGNIAMWAQQKESPASDEEIKEIQSQSEQVSVTPWLHLEDELRKEISRRLVPFQWQDSVDPCQGPDGKCWPQTHITDVLPCIARPEYVTNFEVEGEHCLWWIAYTGEFSPSTKQKVGEIVRSGTRSITSLQHRDFVHWIVTGRCDEYRRLISRESDGDSFDASQSGKTPAVVSMLGTASYGPRFHPGGRHVTVVVGDSIADFCLAYCLRKLGEQALWLPSEWLVRIEAHDGDQFISGALSAMKHLDFGAREREFRFCTTSTPSVLEAQVDVLRRHFALGLAPILETNG